MLKITKSSDPIEVKTITLCGYSPPGLGKTTLAFTAEKPLLLDFDKGAYRAKNRRDIVQIETWADVQNITAEDLLPFSTLIVDTAGRALDVLTSHILKNNPKAANRVGGLSLQGFGELKTVFSTWVKFVRSFGIDVVLLAHSDEQKDGDDLRERLDIQGGSKNEIYKACDVMGRLYLRDGKRMLNFSPTDTAFGKNPAQLPPLEVPNYNNEPNFLAGVIAKIKASLNEFSAEQVEISGLLADWKAKVDGAGVPADFTALIGSAKEIDERIRDNAKRVLAKAAKDKGFSFDKEKGEFFLVVAPAAEPTAASENASAPAAEKPAERVPGADDDEPSLYAAAPSDAELAADLVKAASGRKAAKGKAA